MALESTLSRSQAMSDSCFATLTVPPLESAVCPLVVVEQNSSPLFVITTVCYHNSLGPDVPVLCTDAISRIHGCSPKHFQPWFPQVREGEPFGERSAHGPTLHIWMVSLQIREIPNGVKDALGTLDKTPKALLTQQSKSC